MTRRYVVLRHQPSLTIIVLFVLATLTSNCRGVPADDRDDTTHRTSSRSAEPSVTLSPTQLAAITIAPVATYDFPVDQETVGSIDYDGDIAVQVFPPYQGTVIKMLAALSESVQPGQPLYTIQSPDLIQAESTLIGAAGTFELMSKELARAKNLTGTNGVSERELEQATSDQQAAEGTLKAARNAVRVFGKTDAEIDQLIASRTIDPALVVRSPLSGTITAKNAQPGFLVQPGTPPAPYAVADVTRKWLLASVPEADLSAYQLGQAVHVRVLAYPTQVFTGTVSKIYETVDSTTHRVTVRSEIADSRNVLRPGMLANFTIRVQHPVTAAAVPAATVVREPDGTMTAWVTVDRQRFIQRVVTVGLLRDGQVQIRTGLRLGELVVTKGAVFLSNLLELSS
jgi:cobalt-zinc-cadmium efflux system membrane fusion protein